MNSFRIFIYFRNILHKIYWSKNISLFVVTLIFYGVLWIINPSLYLIAASFFGLIAAYQVIQKNLWQNTLLAFIASTCILNGKTYTLSVIPPGVLPIIAFPDGYTITAIITPTHVLTAILAILLFKNFLSPKTRSLPIKLAHIFFLIFFFWFTLSNLFGSNYPSLSSIYTLLAIPLLIVYIFTQSRPKINNKLITPVIFVTAAVTMFQSVVGLLQLMNHTSFGKNVEVQQFIPPFGEGADELLFRFRPPGTFGHANELALFFSFVLPILLVSAFLYRSKTLMASFLLGAIVLVLTLSRSGWVGFVVGVACSMYLLQKHKWKMPIVFTPKVLLPLIIIFSILIIFFIIPRTEASLNITLTDQTDGLSVRISEIQNAFQLIALHPIFGVGTGLNVLEGLAIEPNGVMSTFPLPVHNTFLLMAVENGLPTMVFYLLFMIFFIRSAFTQKFLAKDRQNIMLTQVVAVGVISSLVVGLLQPFNPYTYLLATTYIGLLS